MTNQVVPRQVSDPVDSEPCSVCVWHIAAGVIIGAIGFGLMLTGALAGPGVVVLTLGVMYAVGAWVVSMIPAKVDPDAIP